MLRLCVVVVNVLVGGEKVGCLGKESWRSSDEVDRRVDVWQTRGVKNIEKVLILLVTEVLL